MKSSSHPTQPNEAEEDSAGRTRLVVDRRPMAGDAAFVVWQLLDSSLPTGGFAHSYGLEAALQLGRFGLAAPEESARVDGLLRFCRQLLRQQALLLLPLVRAGFHASAAGALGDPGAAAEGAAWWRGVRGKEGEHPTLARWAHVDLQCHALITTEGGRRASVAQGQALLRLACEAFPSLLPHHRELLRAARDRIRWAGCRRPHPHPHQHQQQATDAGDADAAPLPAPAPGVVNVKGHHAPIFGWLCHALGVTEGTADRMCLYLVLRDVLAAATRLGLVGPLLSVRLQMALHPDAERAAAHAAASEAANDGRRLGGGPGAGAAAGGYYAEQPPVQDNLMLDILQGAHERLYSRLFIS